MCGHVGVAGNVSAKEERIFRTLLRLDTLRGEDSTGIAALNSAGKFTVVKDAANAYDFLKGKDSKEAFTGWVKILMGHNRAATKGAVVKDNAHPFEFGNIIGAHNGTLNSWHNLLDGDKFKVDSQAVFYHMSEEDPDDLWSKLNGAAALVWMNKAEKSINFLRNSQRDLCYTTTVDGKTFLWASEAWMLHVACAREGLEIEKPVMFRENVHYTLFPCGTNLDMKVRELAPYKPPVVTYSRGNLSQSSTFLPVAADKVGKGDAVKFKIDIVRDYQTSSGGRCNVFGITEAGLPIRIFGVDPLQYEWLINIMSTEDVVFEGLISNKTLYVIEVDITTVFPMYDNVESDGSCCDICKNKIEEGKGHKQLSGKVFCDECQLDIDELSAAGYV